MRRSRSRDRKRSRSKGKKRSNSKERRSRSKERKRSLSKEGKRSPFRETKRSRSKEKRRSPLRDTRPLSSGRQRSRERSKSPRRRRPQRSNSRDRIRSRSRDRRRSRSWERRRSRSRDRRRSRSRDRRRSRSRERERSSPSNWSQSISETSQLRQELEDERRRVKAMRDLLILGAPSIPEPAKERSPVATQSNTTPTVVGTIPVPLSLSPLEQYMARHLEALEERLEIVGIYQPPPIGPYHTKAQKVAKRATELLSQSMLSLPQLLDVYREEGMEALQDKLRAALLGKLSGQPRAVLDQTIKVTKLIVKYFVEESPKFLSLKQQRDKFSSERQPPHPRLASPDKAAEEKYGDYADLSWYLYQYVSDREDVDKMISVLLMKNLNHSELIRLYANADYSPDNLKVVLAAMLLRPYTDHGPARVSLNSFAERVVSYCANESEILNQRRQQRNSYHAGGAYQDSPESSGRSLSYATPITYPTGAFQNSALRSQHQIPPANRMNSLPSPASTSYPSICTTQPPVIPNPVSAKQSNQPNSKNNSSSSSSTSNFWASVAKNKKKPPPPPTLSAASQPKPAACALPAAFASAGFGPLANYLKSTCGYADENIQLLIGILQQSGFQTNTKLVHFYEYNKKEFSMCVYKCSKDSFNKYAPAGVKINVFLNEVADFCHEQILDGSF